MVGTTAGKLFLPDSSGNRVGILVSGVRRMVADRNPSSGDGDQSRRRRTGTAGGRRGQIHQQKRPEERIVEVVSRNGDGVKQKDVVDATEWSESTVSRTLCKLEADGTVVRYQIGREKIVFLPERVPTALGPSSSRADRSEPTA